MTIERGSKGRVLFQEVHTYELQGRKGEVGAAVALRAVGAALRGRPVAGICLVLAAGARWAMRGCAGLPVRWHHGGRCLHGHCKAEAKERQGVPGSLQLWCCTRCPGELLPR